MKHIYLLFSILFASALQSQIINFPDANFKAKLLQSNTTNMIAYDANENPIVVDTNANGEIEVSEAQNVFFLHVNNSGIADLTGISNFVNLKGLLCANNSLTFLTIDNTISLLYINASHNAIGSISVNFDDEVYSLDLSYNNLTSFTADSSFYRDSFDLSHNQLSSLVFNNAFIENSNISNNNLTQLQFVGDVTFHGYGNFTHNQFALLDLSQALFTNHFVIKLGFNAQDVVLFDDSIQPSNIEYSSDNVVVDMGNFNRITDCDPEYTGHVTISDCPNLQHVIFKNGYNHTAITCNEGGTIFQNPSMALQISNCPNLSRICVDPIEQPFIQARINQLGLQGQVNVDANCNFNPDGTLETAFFSFEEPFSIYPVPATTDLQIMINPNIEINTKEIFNVLGQVVLSENGTDRIIDVSQLSKGSYILKVQTAETSYIKYFLKE